MIEKLKERWGLANAYQVVVVLLVFACTGFTIMYLKKPLLGIFISEADQGWVVTVAYYLFILPLYNIVLLFYGFLFGQFRFFWNFEKKMIRRMTGDRTVK